MLESLQGPQKPSIFSINVKSKRDIKPKTVISINICINVYYKPVSLIDISKVHFILFKIELILYRIVL